MGLAPVRFLFSYLLRSYKHIETLARASTRRGASYCGRREIHGRSTPITKILFGNHFSNLSFDIFTNKFVPFYKSWRKQ